MATYHPNLFTAFCSMTLLQELDNVLHFSSILQNSTSRTLISLMLFPVSSRRNRFSSLPTPVVVLCYVTGGREPCSRQSTQICPKPEFQSL